MVDYTLIMKLVRQVAQLQMSDSLVSQPLLQVYWQGSLLVGWVGSNVETEFLDVSASDMNRESLLQLLNEIVVIELACMVTVHAVVVNFSETTIILYVCMLDWF